MVRKFVLSAMALALVASLGGCLSLNWDEDVRMIDKYGRDADGIRKLTNKYLFNYDADNPFDN